jgi:hypothetical protein
VRRFSGHLGTDGLAELALPAKKYRIIYVRFRTGRG